MTTQSNVSSGIQWNAGGWFGSVVGSTAWMLVCAIFLMFHGQNTVAAINVACFAIANAVAVALWLNRSKISAYPALLTLLATLSFAIPIAWLATAQFASDNALAAMNWPTSSIVTALILFATPVVTLIFVLRENASTKPETQTHAG